LFVARAETVFLSSVSMASVEFLRSDQLIRTEAGKKETAVRSATQK
jgi:hypothetical protein